MICSFLGWTSLLFEEWLQQCSCFYGWNCPIVAVVLWLQLSPFAVALVFVWIACFWQTEWITLSLFLIEWIALFALFKTANCSLQIEWREQFTVFKSDLLFLRVICSFLGWTLVVCMVAIAERLKLFLWLQLYYGCSFFIVAIVLWFQLLLWLQFIAGCSCFYVMVAIVLHLQLF